MALLAGCATTRQITISAKPDDAAINIDGTDRGRGPITEKFTFHGSDDVHHVTASRLGYTPQVVDLTRKFDKSDLFLELQPRTREILLHVTPVPAAISIDGKPQGELGPSPICPFRSPSRSIKTISGRSTIAATRPGYQSAEQVVKWDDSDEPVRADA